MTKPRPTSIPVPAALFSDARLSWGALGLAAHLSRQQQPLQWRPEPGERELWEELVSKDWIVMKGDVATLRSTLPAAKVPKPKLAPEGFTELIEGWHVEYEKRWGFKYDFVGGRDGAAVKGLLNLGTVPELMELAKRAWAAGTGPKTHFWCAKATTLHAFKERYNQIRAELAAVPARCAEGIKAKEL